MPALLQAFARLVALKRLGVLLFVLAATLCASSNASALEPTQTKTRVWGFDFAEHNSDGLFRPATSGKHQGNRVALSEIASGCLLAAEGAAANVTAPNGYSAAFEFQLKPSELGKPRDFHFRRGAVALEEAMQNTPGLEAAMREMVHPDITSLVSKTGGRATKIPGWTWEHVHSGSANQRVGVMRLVPEYQHTPGSPWWRAIHPEPGAAGGYSEWAIPAGAPPN